MHNVSESFLFRLPTLVLAGKLIIVRLIFTCQTKYIAIELCSLKLLSCQSSQANRFVEIIVRQTLQHFFSFSISFLSLQIFQRKKMVVKKACRWVLMLNMRMRWRNDRWFISYHWQISDPLNSSFKYFFNLQSKGTRVNWCFYYAMKLMDIS